MINPLTVIARFDNNHLDVQGLKLDDQEDELLIKQKIKAIVVKIFSSFKYSSSIQQINFIFSDDKNFKVVIQTKEGNFEYDLNQMDQDLKIRSQHLIGLIHKVGTFSHQSLAPLKVGKVTQNLAGQSELENASSQRSIISRIFTSIRRWLGTTFVVEPAVQKLTTSFFANASKEKNLRDKWESSQEAINNLVDNLYQELNAEYKPELFSKEELFQRVSGELEKAFASHFEAITGKVLSEQEMRVLRNERKVQEAVSHFQTVFDEVKAYEETHLSREELTKTIKDSQQTIEDCKTNIKRFEGNIGLLTLKDMKKNPNIKKELESELQEWRTVLAEYEGDLKEWQEDLHHLESFEVKQAEALKKAEEHWVNTIDPIPAIDFPIEQLAYLPVNVHTENYLIHTWNRVLTELAEKGNLTHIVDSSQDPVKSSKQVHFADAYLLARQLLPREFQETFNEIHHLDTDKIERFIRSQPNALGLKSFPQNDMTQKQQRIFQDLIRPVIDEEKKALLDDYKDFASIAELIKDRQSEYLIDLVLKIEKKLDIHHISADERQKLDLTREKLLDHLIQDIEQLGIEQYYLSNEQIIRLRNHREALFKRSESIQSFEKDIQAFQARLKEISSKIKGATNKKHTAKIISSTDELPELSISVFDLSQKELAAYAKRNNEELTKLKDQISKLQSKNKKAVIDPKLQTKRNDLIKKQKQLEQALEKWDQRHTIINPPFLATTPKMTINLLELSEKQIQLIQSNIALVEQEISSLEGEMKTFGENPTKKQQLKQLNMNKDRLQAILDKPNKIREQEDALKNLKEDQQKLAWELEELIKETFKDIPVLDLPVETLGKTDINASNQVDMSEVWRSILKALHGIMSDKSKPYAERGQAQLQYKLARHTLAQQKSLPQEFKDHINAELEKLEKPFESTQKIIDRLSQVTSQEAWSEEIKSIKPSDIQFDQLAAVSITEANKDANIALWTHLVEQSIKPIKDHLTQLNSKEFVEKLTSEDLKQYEEAVFSCENIERALKQVSSPLVDEKIEALRENAKQVATPDIRKKIMSEGSHRFNVEKEALELTGAEILIGEVKKTPKPATAKGSPPPKSDLNEFEIQGLKVLAKAIASLDLRKETKLSEEEEKLLQDFIQYARQPGPHSHALNAKLREITEGKRPGTKQTLNEMLFNSFSEDDRIYKRIPYGISLEAVELVLGVTYQLRYAQQFEPLANKLEKLLDKIEKEETITPQDQMTFKELGVLAKCAKIGNDKGGKSLLTRLQEIGAMEADQSIAEFKNASKRAQELLIKINDKFQQEASYRDGDFVANVGAKKHEFHGHKATFEEQLHFKLITPFSHGAKIYVENGQKKLSHVLGGYVQGEYQFVEDAYSEVWRLDVAAMIPKEQQDLLKSVYGDHWKDEIQKKYEVIENGIHKNEKKQFDDIDNPWDRRMNAGKADYIWGGHVKKGETDFIRLTERILGDAKEGQDHITTMICSEFVTKTSLAALVKLNQKLSEEIGEYLIKHGQQEQGEKIKKDQNIFELPVSKKESLKNVHPGRMIDLFKQRNCIKRVEPPKIVQQVVAQAA